MEKTIKELQGVAKKNGFYLIPEKLFGDMCTTIQVIREERDALRIRRDNLKKQIRELKNDR